MTTPWVCYGQTTVNQNSTLQNPTPNSTGLVGEVTSLPYTVPSGKQLKLTTFGCEPLQGFAMIPWIGDTFAANKCLMTVVGRPYILTDGAPSYLWDGFNYVLPAGTKLNLFMQSSTSPDGMIYAWYMGGELQDA